LDSKKDVHSICCDNSSDDEVQMKKPDEMQDTRDVQNQGRTKTQTIAQCLVYKADSEYRIVHPGFTKENQLVPLWFF
jgi:hypothetical protein